MKWFLEALRRSTRPSRGGRDEASTGTSCCSTVLAIVALAIVDGIAGTFSEEAEIGLFSGLFVLATIRAESRRDGAPTARHRSERLVGPDQPRSLLGALVCWCSRCWTVSRVRTGSGRIRRGVGSGDSESECGARPGPMSRKKKPTIVVDSEGHSWGPDDFDLDSCGVEAPINDRLRAQVGGGAGSDGRGRGNVMVRAGSKRAFSP